MTPHHNNYDLIREGQERRNKRKRNKNLGMILAGAVFALGSVGLAVIAEDDRDMIKKASTNYSANVLNILDKNQDGSLSKVEVKSFYDFFGLNSENISLDSITSPQWNYFSNNYK